MSRQNLIIPYTQSTGDNKNFQTLTFEKIELNPIVNPIVFKFPEK